MDTIPEKLADTQILLHQYTVYTTEATPHKITPQYDGILFFSPSAVESFFSLNTIDEATKCFAVGNTTAKSLKPYTNNIIVADAASGDAMLSKVMETG
ncbi:uroporphyrinogen-III synthase [Niabella ginsengisoli]|uniref:Uroporphyrinogen-III synthase n=1 Tax=Niabella ginsengisoli TaxID=522298 RepID=A0ABS9SEW0_9BACT|nr:uroporphyrinogen-III synthase [Niabella ginsengisoli]MCH5596894.1 uroporphyrinogen-III synthase [Niabella ginsengisoli]